MEPTTEENVESTEQTTNEETKEVKVEEKQEGERYSGGPIPRLAPKEDKS